MVLVDATHYNSMYICCDFTYQLLHIKRPLMKHLWYGLNSARERNHLHLKCVLIVPTYADMCLYAIKD